MSTVFTHSSSLDWGQECWGKKGNYKPRGRPCAWKYVGSRSKSSLLYWHFIYYLIWTVTGGRTHSWYSLTGHKLIDAAWNGSAISPLWALPVCLPTSTRLEREVMREEEFEIAPRTPTPQQCLSEKTRDGCCVTLDKLPKPSELQRCICEWKWIPPSVFKVMLG